MIRDGDAQDTELAALLQTARMCRDLAEGLIRQTKGTRKLEDPQKHALQGVVWALSAKCLDTFDALLVLCAEGWGVEASVLLRVLLEAVVNMAFLLKQPHSGLFAYLRGTVDDDGAQARAIESIARREELPPDMTRRLEKARKSEVEVVQALARGLGEPPRTDDWAWCGKGENRRHRRWTREISMREKAMEVGMEWAYDEIYGLTSINVHSSAGIQSIYLTDTPSPGLHIGPKAAWAKATLPLACRTLLVGLSSLDEVFALGADSAIQEHRGIVNAHNAT